MICGSCGESLEATVNQLPYLSLSNGIYFHQKCFQCSSCGSLLDNAMPFAQRNGKYLHLKVWLCDSSWSCASATNCSIWNVLDVEIQLVWRDVCGWQMSADITTRVLCANIVVRHSAHRMHLEMVMSIILKWVHWSGINFISVSINYTHPSVFAARTRSCRRKFTWSSKDESTIEMYFHTRFPLIHFIQCLRCFVCDTELHSKPFKPTGDNYTCVDCIGVASIAATTNQPSHLTRSALVSKTGTSPSHRKTNENITPQPHTRDDPAAPSNLPSTPASTTSSPIDCTTDAPSDNLDTSANRDSKNNPSPLETFNCNHAAPSSPNSSLSSPRFISASATASDRNEADVLEASCDRLSPSSKSNINHSISDFSISLKDPSVPPRSTPSSPPPPPPQPLSKAPPKRLSVLPFSLLNQIKSGNPLTLLRKPPPSTSFNNESENSIKTALSAALQKMRMFTETPDEDDDY